MRGIADTGFLVAFANARDQHHSWALDVAEDVTEPLLTCEAVLAEAAFHLGDAGLVLEMISEELIRLDLSVTIISLLWLLCQSVTRIADRTWPISVSSE